MAVTLEEIGKWLDKKEVSYDANSEESTMGFGVTDGKTKSFVTIKLKENLGFSVHVKTKLRGKVWYLGIRPCRW